MVYDNKGEYEKALDYYNKSLKIYIQTLGENHPDVATSFNNMGKTNIYQLISIIAKQINF